jgi:TRAP-type C4-dicarboxylate transport system permease small subunit
MGKRSIQRAVELFLAALIRVEDGILVLLLALMISLAVLQILLRNLFDAGIFWSDALLRILVLWIGLVGAMVATRGDKHITINLVARFLPEKIKAIADGIAKLFTAVVCAITARYSFYLIQLEYADGGAAFGLVPIWVCEAIIPLAFTVIALRYLVMALGIFSSSSGKRFSSFRLQR